MKTAMQELINYIESIMSLYEKNESEMLASDRKAYDAYYNILVHAKSKLSFEKQQIIESFDKGSLDGMASASQIEKGLEYEDKSGEQYYNETFKQ